MPELKNSLSIAALGAGLTFGAPAEAAIISYDATISYTNDSNSQTGDLLFRLSYDDQAADTNPSPFGGSFPVLSFEIRDLTGALGFGSASSASGDTARIIILTSFIDFDIDSAQSDDLLRFTGFPTIADPNVLFEIDLTDLTLGEAYGGFEGGFGTSFTPTQVVANVPLPSSLALMSLVAGGVAMRAAAKSRRAAKRAKAV